MNCAIYCVITFHLKRNPQWARKAMKECETYSWSGFLLRTARFALALILPFSAGHAAATEISNLSPASAQSTSKAKPAQITSSTSNYLCIDNSYPTILNAIKLIKLSASCSDYKIVDPAGPVKISDISDVINLTASSPAIKSSDFSYWATKINTKAYYLKAFGPTISMSGGRTYSYTGTSTATNITTNNGAPVNVQQNQVSLEPSWTNSIAPQINIPLFFPAQISLAKYYGAIEVSTAYSSTDADLQQYTSTLSSFLNLWVARQQLLIANQNIVSAIKSLDVTVSQYRLGLLAVPDVAQSLTNLRTYQSNSVSAILAYNSELFTLAGLLGFSPKSLTIEDSSFDDSSVAVLNRLPLPNISTLAQSAINNASQVYSTLLQAEAALKQSRYYLAQYIPSFGLAFGWAPSNEYLRYQVNSGGNTIQQYSQNVDTWSNSISIGFSWNLFDSFSAATSAASQRKISEKYVQEAKYLAYQKIADAGSAYSQIKAYEAQLEQINQAIVAANISYNNTLTAVKAGFSDVTTLTQRLNQLTSAKSNYWSTYKQLLTSKINLSYLTRQGIFEKVNPYQLPFDGGVLKKWGLLP